MMRSALTDRMSWQHRSLAESVNALAPLWSRQCRSPNVPCSFSLRSMFARRARLRREELRRPSATRQRKMVHCRNGSATLHLMGVLLVILALTTVAWAESVTVPPAVLEAETARVAAMESVKDTVLAVFSPTGGGGGSGVVISPDGFALTNYHVVRPCGNAMKCGMADGKLYDGVIVGIDPAGDVALIKLFGRDDFPVAELGDSDQVRMGDECFAMGNPFVLATDFQPTVTWGIVSGTHRYQYPAGTLLEYTDCLQTDASINPGNSGGPLFNARGQLIGINGRASFEKRGRVNVGVAYAISINQIKNFLGQLHSGRIVDHATLGATVAFDHEGNVVVDDILEESDAYRRGLRFMSPILTFGGRTITTPNQFKNVLGIYPKGWQVPLSFRHDGKRHDVVVRLRGLHSEEELIEKTSGAEAPTPMLPDEPQPEDDDSEKPDRDGNRTPAPGDGGSQPGSDPDAPQPAPDGPRRIQIPGRPGGPAHRVVRPEAPMPEVAKKHFESKRGFANYYFNKLHQDRILKAWRSEGKWGEVDRAWSLSGQLGNGGQFELTITDDTCRLKLPTTELDWTAPDHLETDLAPPESGGLFPALLLWRRLAVAGPDAFEKLFYLGTMPLPGYENQLDVLVGQYRGVVAWFYYVPDDGRLVAVDLFSDGDDADPCQVRMLNFRDEQGRQRPTRIEVYHAGSPFASFQIDAWQFREDTADSVEGTP